MKLTQHGTQAVADVQDRLYGRQVQDEKPITPQHVFSSGLAGWLARFWMQWQRSIGSAAHRSRLALIERLPLGPKQTLLLVEADGMRLLLSISSEGAPVFFPLSEARFESQEAVSDVMTTLSLGSRRLPLLRTRRRRFAGMKRSGRSTC
ncbi:flagellar biosynthetic protein FliO [Acidicapsa ligni]|uniref:flagellar biosynthetic protein FliO n=1 Tax=Acidicapsa ligni TaxID=542300 RepID=UPI0037BFEE03